MPGSTGPSRFKLVSSEGMGDQSFEEALSRCPFRSVVWPSARRGEAVPLDACVAVLGPRGRLHPQLLERLMDDISHGRTFMIAAENQDSLDYALRAVDQMALAIMRPAGNA
jgi:hypothetical protein